MSLDSSLVLVSKNIFYLMTSAVYDCFSFFFSGKVFGHCGRSSSNSVMNFHGFQEFENGSESIKVSFFEEAAEVANAMVAKGVISLLFSASR